MDLFEEIIREDFGQNPIIKMNEKNEHPKVVYEKLTVEEPFDQPISSLAQYFLAPFLLVDSNGIFDIPAVDKIIQDIVIKEIAPHFNKTVKVSYENQIIIRVQNVKESSKTHFLNLIKNHRVNAIVNDLYSKDPTNWEGNFTIKEYKVNLHAVKKSVENDILPMWNFFERSFVRAYGDLVILPNGWVFDESFKARIAVQAFAGVCNSMTITVNQENKMISSIQIN